ncbi:unnamed protein product [Brugia pahangi]|uniref:Anaphylatoxin-like domain-containing protein n=1 Tax=Brugia pahangi TaxID=6280 RepID=A0A0N4TWE4_BRUPA|nr:unnamed protein product [Brugia pahangi]
MTVADRCIIGRRNEMTKTDRCVIGRRDEMTKTDRCNYWTDGMK